MSETKAPFCTVRFTPDSASMVPRPRRKTFDTSVMEMPDTSPWAPTPLAASERDCEWSTSLRELDPVWSRARHPRSVLVCEAAESKTLAWGREGERSCSKSLRSTHNVYTHAAIVSRL